MYFLGSGADLVVLQTAAGPDNPCWIEGRCLSYGVGFAYLLWQNLLRDLLGVAPSTPTPATSEALRSATRRMCPDRFADVYPYLARLLSLPLEPEYEVVRDPGPCSGPPGPGQKGVRLDSASKLR